MIKLGNKYNMVIKFYILACKLSYDKLRQSSKTHFRERHLFKDNTSAFQFQTQLSHHLADAMATMDSDVAFFMSFDEKQFNSHFRNHLEKPATSRVKHLFDANYFLDVEHRRRK